MSTHFPITSQILAGIPFFADLPHEELERLFASLDVRQLRIKEELFREGDHGEDFYVIVDGELDVLLGVGTDEELLLNTLRAGEYFGEMSLIMEGGCRTASVRAKSPSILLAMSRQQFMDLIRRHPRLVTSLMRMLSQRLDATNTATYRDLREKNRQLQQAYDELKAAQAQLIEKERLEQELKVAADMQLSILPDELPEADGFSFGACMLPARQVGGDFYDVFRISDEKIGLVIGDVADKGVPSALFMARAHALIMAEASKESSAGEVLERVNGHITRLHKTPQIVTALYGILNLNTRELDYARAGHDPPLLLHADGKVERLPHGRGMALGLWEDIVIDQGRLVLSPGATLLMYTDGMTDCRDAHGRPFGLERIKETLSGIVARDARHVCSLLLEALKNYQGSAPQDDDVTLVAVQARGA